MASGLGAGLGADMLQAILQRQAQQQQQGVADQLAQAKLALDQQQAAQDAQIKQETLRSLVEQRQSAEALAKETGAEKIASTLIAAGGGQDVPIDPTTQQTLTQGGLGGIIRQTPPTLSSTNLSGTPLQLGGGTLTQTANPGQPGGAYLPGDPQKQMLRTLLNDPALSPSQKQLITYRLATGSNAPENFTAKPTPDAQPIVQIGRDGQLHVLGTAPTGAKVVEQPAPPQPQLLTVQTVDANGNPVTKVVPKTAGATFAKAPSATTETRLQSAQAVKQTGDDIIGQLSDPAIAAQIGPLMGRYHSVQEFIGDPPPEFARLAGEIESFSLANMGVHGMRSAQGAQMIQQLLNQRLTPQALIGAIQGLQGFTQHFLQNNGRGGTAPPTDPAATAAALLKKYGGG